MRQMRLLPIATILLLASCVHTEGGGENQYFTEAPSSNVECYITEWPGDKDKALVFTWDDNMSGAKTVAEIFDKHGYKTTFFVNTAAYDNWKYRVLNPFMKRMFQHILDNGHEIGSHTRNHSVLTKIDEQGIITELSSSAIDIQKLWGIVPSTMSHPTSKYNLMIDSLVHLYYLDSRYSMDKDNDSTIRYMQVRTAYNFKYYKEQLDLYFASNANRFVFGGHQLTSHGSGYEPMPDLVLDSLLDYVGEKYQEDCWVTTFENMTMCGMLRDNVKIVNKNGQIYYKLGSMTKVLNKYPHPSAYITLCFPNENLDFSSEGLVDFWFKEGNSYCTIDLRKTEQLRYSVMNQNIEPQKAMRN